MAASSSLSTSSGRYLCCLSGLEDNAFGAQTFIVEQRADSRRILCEVRPGILVYRHYDGVGQDALGYLKSHLVGEGYVCTVADIRKRRATDEEYCDVYGAEFVLNLLDDLER